MDERPNAASQSLMETGRRVLAKNYAPGSLALVSGYGARVRDADGHEYIDLGTGISVTSFGHRNPDIAAAVHAQLDRLWHVSNLYYSEPSVALADELVQASFAERVFFCNSGSESTEAAIKLVRKAASASRPPEQRNILTFTGSFHGRTLAAVTATAQPKYHAGFEPLPVGFRYCPFNNVAALREALDDTVCAVFVEPLQGEGGIVPAQAGFLSLLRRLCDEHGAFLVVDEVQCGMSRTGRLWAHQWEDHLVPDAMLLAKALGGGLPIGAVLLGARLADALQPGSHGSTFGGNPIVCAGARAALKLARSPDLLANVQRQGAYLAAGLRALDDEFDLFDEVRGLGLMLGAKLKPERADLLGPLLTAFRHRGVIVLSAGGDVVRFLPPLTIDESTLNEALSAMRLGVMDVLASA